MQICTDFPIFEIILLHRNLRKAIKKQTLSLTFTKWNLSVLSVQLGIQRKKKSLKKKFSTPLEEEDGLIILVLFDLFSNDTNFDLCN